MLPLGNPRHPPPIARGSKCLTEAPQHLVLYVVGEIWCG